MSFEKEEEGRKSDERKELRWNISIPVSVKAVRRDGTELERGNRRSRRQPLRNVLSPDRGVAQG